MRTSTVLAGLAAAAGASAQLNTLAQRAGLMYWGNAVSVGQLSSDAAYARLVDDTSEHGSLVPENAQKWETVQPSRGTFVYTQGDVISQRAMANGQILRCHTLTWHSQLPGWVANGQWTRATLQAVIETHIANVMRHYLGQCYAWDVVNEAVDDNGNWRDSVFYRTFGTDYVPISFVAARAADPDTKLYYNDYNLEYNGAKTNRAFELIQIIQAAGAPIDGVGFQGHLIVGSTPGRSALATTLRRFTALGVEVAYTELDIRHSSLPPSAAGLATQGNDYANVVGSCLDVDGCVGVTVWGISDRYSWIPNTFPGQGAALLYDDNYSRKPAWTSVSSLLAAAATGVVTSTRTSSSSPVTSTRVSATSTTRVTSSTSTRTSTSSSAAPTGAAANRWEQCGGRNWPGPTRCVSPWVCTVLNEWYSQCL
ncbi:hypothetical protein S40285_05002 [Stachybotrys chlorohalonatus IBT 40285]|uniref:Beta-xylanase n=1 Tax=Stachybotrys chlorohalonatus (strain IBT 40285) TaxID=1283841 RepID=A0A084QRV2_STAC4|nr:hypothetical protein S40285_05002 [Stachybotrys chlorohalonata IBT 40285]